MMGVLRKTALLLLLAVISEAAEVQKHDEDRELLRRARNDAKVARVDASGRLLKEQKTRRSSIASASTEQSLTGNHRTESTAMTTATADSYRMATFEGYDRDKSGTLEHSEAEHLLRDIGFTSSEWPMLLHNGGGVITQHAWRRLTTDMDMWAAADKNKSGFLEAPEVGQVLKSAGLSDKAFPWQQWDHDGDNRLSKAEFLAAGPAVAHIVLQQATALLQEDKPHENFHQKEYVDEDDLEFREGLDG